MKTETEISRELAFIPDREERGVFHFFDFIDAIRNLSCTVKSFCILKNQNLKLKQKKRRIISGRNPNPTRSCTYAYAD